MMPAVRPPSTMPSGRRKRRMERAAMRPQPSLDQAAQPTQHGQPAGIDMVLSQLADSTHPVSGGL